VDKVEKIVVGVSDTASMKAVEWVIDRAGTRLLEVTLVAAYDWTGMPFSEVTTMLREVRSRIGVASPRTVVHLVKSAEDPDGVLAEATMHADLLVIGSHQRSQLQERFGVRSLRLARHGNCPTVIVPEEWTPRYAGTVVVGLDAASSASALEFAAHEAEERGARLEVVHAWTAPLPAFDPLVWLVDTEGELRTEHRNHLDEALDRLQSGHPAARVSGYLEECLPAAALRDRGAAADLVVIGSLRDGPIVRAILGSTARELLRDAVVPLCIVPSAVGRPGENLVPALSSKQETGD
jgi:nucleotide-binding universal stress UspA family protein